MDRLVPSVRILLSVAKGKKKKSAKSRKNGKYSTLWEVDAFPHFYNRRETTLVFLIRGMKDACEKGETNRTESGKGRQIKGKRERSPRHLGSSAYGSLFKRSSSRRQNFVDIAEPKIRERNLHLRKKKTERIKVFITQIRVRSRELKFNHPQRWTEKENIPS